MTRWLINISPWPSSSIPLRVPVAIPVSAAVSNGYVCGVMGGEVIIKAFAGLLLLSYSVWPVTPCMSWTLKLSVRSLVCRDSLWAPGWLRCTLHLPAIFSPSCGFVGHFVEWCAKVSFKDASSNDLNKTKVSSSKQKPLFPCQSPHSLPGFQFAGKCILQPGQNQPLSRPLTGSVGLWVHLVWGWQGPN